LLLTAEVARSVFPDTATIRLLVVPSPGMPTDMFTSLASFIARSFSEIPHGPSPEDTESSRRRSVFPRAPTLHEPGVLRLSVQELETVESDWAELTVSRRILGVLGLHSCAASTLSLREAQEHFELLCSAMPTALCSRLFAFDPADDEADLDYQDGSSHTSGRAVVLVPPADTVQKLHMYLSTLMEDFASQLVTELERWVFTLDQQAFIASRIDGAATADEISRLKRRKVGRSSKLKGDVALLLCSPEDALGYFRAAVDAAKATGDHLWLAASWEGAANAITLRAQQQALAQREDDLPDGPREATAPAPLQAADLHAVVTRLRDAARLYRSRKCDQPTLALEAYVKLARLYATQSVAEAEADPHLAAVHSLAAAGALLDAFDCADGLGEADYAALCVDAAATCSQLGLHRKAARYATLAATTLATALDRASGALALLAPHEAAQDIPTNPSDWQTTAPAWPNATLAALQTRLDIAQAAGDSDATASLALLTLRLLALPPCLVSTDAALTELAEDLGTLAADTLALSHVDVDAPRGARGLPTLDGVSIVAPPPGRALVGIDRQGDREREREERQREAERVFITSPFDRARAAARAAASSSTRSSRAHAVGEQLQVSVTLTNPLPVSLYLDTVTCVVETRERPADGAGAASGSPVAAVPSPLDLPPFATVSHTVTLLLDRPCTVGICGVRVGMGSAKGVQHVDMVTGKVVPAGRGTTTGEQLEQALLQDNPLLVADVLPRQPLLTLTLPPKLVLRLGEETVVPFTVTNQSRVPARLTTISVEPHRSLPTPAARPLVTHAEHVDLPSAISTRLHTPLLSAPPTPPQLLPPGASFHSTLSLRGVSSLDAIALAIPYGGVGKEDDEDNRKGKGSERGEEKKEKEKEEDEMDGAVGRVACGRVPIKVDEASSVVPVGCSVTALPPSASLGRQLGDSTSPAWAEAVLCLSLANLSTIDTLVVTGTLSPPLVPSQVVQTVSLPPHSTSVLSLPLLRALPSAPSAAGWSLIPWDRNDPSTDPLRAAVGEQERERQKAVARAAAVDVGPNLETVLTDAEACRLLVTNGLTVRWSGPGGGGGVGAGGSAASASSDGEVDVFAATRLLSPDDVKRLAPDDLTLTWTYGEAQQPVNQDGRIAVPLGDWTDLTLTATLVSARTTTQARLSLAVSVDSLCGSIRRAVQEAEADVGGGGPVAFEQVEESSLARQQAVARLSVLPHVAAQLFVDVRVDHGDEVRVVRRALLLDVTGSEEGSGLADGDSLPASPEGLWLSALAAEEELSLSLLSLSPSPLSLSRLPPMPFEERDRELERQKAAQGERKRSKDVKEAKVTVSNGSGGGAGEVTSAKAKGGRPPCERCGVGPAAAMVTLRSEEREGASAKEAERVYLCRACTVEVEGAADKVDAVESAVNKAKEKEKEKEKEVVRSSRSSVSSPVSKIASKVSKRRLH